MINRILKIEQKLKVRVWDLDLLSLSNCDIALLAFTSQGVLILSIVSLLWKLSIFTFSSDRSKQPSYVFIQPNSSLYMICPENIPKEGSEVMRNSV